VSGVLTLAQVRSIDARHMNMDIKSFVRDKVIYSLHGFCRNKSSSHRKRTLPESPVKNITAPLIFLAFIHSAQLKPSVFDMFIQEHQSQQKGIKSWILHGWLYFLATCLSSQDKECLMIDGIRMPHRMTAVNLTRCRGNSNNPIVIVQEE
jgi:hypothetical protein